MSDSQHDNLLYSPVRIVVPRGVRAGAPVDGDLQAINERFAVEPLDADAVFVFDGIASTDALDTYYTRMDAATSLANFARDFTEGQALLDSHDSYRLPLGSSFRAVTAPITLAEGQAATTQVQAGFFMLRGHQLGSVNTDDYIRGIVGGTYRKMSVGFGGADLRYICDIDGLDLFSYDSDYWPGQKLSDGRIVTYTIYDAHALEESIVYKNATPGSLIQRVQELAGQRQIPASEVHRLEARWNVRFAQKSPQHFVKGPSHMDEKELARSTMNGINTRVGKKLSQASRDRLSTAVDSMGAATDVISALLEETAEDAETGRMVRSALGNDIDATKLATLKTEAEAGRAYRTSRIAEAVAARIAAEGDTFTTEKADRFKARLERMSMEDIEDDHATWTAQKRATFAPGRQIPAGQVRQDGNAGALPVDDVEE